ncbi:PspC domain-containing protein [Paenibacillus amylolyticus]|nr:PspC domain-containing protein [Paenibacillus amylolyticus]
MSKLYRSARNRMLTGLIGGISENLGLSTTLLRIIFFISIFATGRYIIVDLLHRCISGTKGIQSR